MSLPEDFSKKLRTSRLNRRRFAVSAAAGTAAIVAGSRGVRAQSPATPASADSIPIADGLKLTTVATGLNAPRFITIEGSTVYFTESGSGGDTPIFGTPAVGTPVAPGSLSQSGRTGKLSSLAADGTVTAIVKDFFSYTFGAHGEIVGAAGLALDGAGRAYVAVGAPGPYISSIALSGEEDVVFEVELATGAKKVIADIGRYEITSNPDPVAIDSNLYGAAFADGILYVADAGGNTVYGVTVATGEFQPFAVTGGIEAAFLPPSGNPLRAGAREIDSVPSGVAIGPDGKIYVGFVTGGPFPAGLAPVYAYAPDGTRSVFATGLTMIGGLAFSSDGTLYATIISTDFLKQAPGMLVRVGADGNHKVIVDNLIVPAGLAFDADDNLYLANKSTGFPGGGELLKYAGVTKVAGSPLVIRGSSSAPSASPAASPAAQAAELVAIEMMDVKFNTTEISIPAGTDVTFTFENKGALQHDFTIDSPPLSSGTLASGETATLKVNVPAGAYTYYCSQIGHRQAGMLGTLTAR